MWILGVVACKKVEPAPADLDGLLHLFWQRYDDGDDAELDAALHDLDEVIDGAALHESFDGTISRLTTDEAAQVGVTDRDPVLAAGIFLVNVFECDPGQLEEILSYPAQDELYDGVYSAYSRSFDTPLDDWLAGDDARVDYGIAYTADIVGAEYVANSRGALRRVEADDFGPFVAQRSYMPAPAEFEEGSNKSMDQDYQLEVYWTSAGHVVHAYGMWRQANFGSGFDSEGAAAQRLLLNGLLDWDDDTAALCAEGRP